jgi:outer membrane protein
MNKILLLLNLIIIAGAIYLFTAHHHAYDNSAAAGVIASNPTLHSQAAYRIAYVNSDSLWYKYTFVQEMKDELAAEKLKIEGQYTYKMKKLEEEVIEFQQKAQFMTQQQGQQREGELMQKQQELLQLQESLNTNFIESEQDKNKVVYDSITNYIDIYSKENNIHYVLGYNLSGSMFYGADTLNITEDIVIALNNRFTSTKKE